MTKSKILLSVMCTLIVFTGCENIQGPTVPQSNLTVGKVQQNISKGELLIIPNSTHYVPFEQPKILNEAILKFLKK